MALQQLPGAMTLGDAVQAVCLYLQRHEITFRLHSAQPIDKQSFAVKMLEVFPESKVLSFQVLPEEVADCWRMVEVKEA